MRIQSVPSQARATMALLVVLLSVNFLLTYTPSARAAGTRADLSGTAPGSDGGPDDPDDGSGTHGKIPHNTALPHLFRTGVSVPSTPNTPSTVHGRVRAIQQDRSSASWLMVVRTLIQALWQVR